MNRLNAFVRPRSSPRSSVLQPTLQRKCACGKPIVSAGECAECGRKRQRAPAPRIHSKLRVSKPDDRFEQEAVK